MFIRIRSRRAIYLTGTKEVDAASKYHDRGNGQQFRNGAGMTKVVRNPFRPHLYATGHGAAWPGAARFEAVVG